MRQCEQTRRTLAWRCALRLQMSAQLLCQVACVTLLNASLNDQDDEAIESALEEFKLQGYNVSGVIRQGGDTAK
jgi:hypothetical protein